METPKVTVCMCTYNRSMLMLRSIKCIIDQDFKDLELLIINDGSTDNTEEVLLQLEKQDSRIRHITKNHDFISTRTTAFKEAKENMDQKKELWITDVLDYSYNQVNSKKLTLNTFKIENGVEVHILI